MPEEITLRGPRCRVTLCGSWPAVSAGARAEEFFEREIEVELLALPTVGDTLELEGGQGVTITERTFKLDGSIDLWVGDFAGWSRDDVAALFLKRG